MDRTFCIKMPREIIFGNDSSKNLGIFIIKSQYKKCLFVVGSHVNVSDYIGCILTQSKQTQVRDIIMPSHEPVKSELDIIVQKLGEFKPDVIIGIGGGSVLDSAKYISVAVSCPSDTTIEFGVDKISFECIPLILIPTTAGTGSEVTRICIVKDIDGIKKAIVSDKILGEIAIVDPKLSMDMPSEVLASSGFDAICHATEAYLSSKGNSITDFFALQALNLLVPALYFCFNDKDSSLKSLKYNYIQRLAQGSLFAGIALENAGVNLVHALAYPISSLYRFSHGISNALIYPACIHHLNSKLRGNYKKKLEEILNFFRLVIKSQDGAKEITTNYLNSIGINCDEIFQKINRKEVTIEKMSSSAASNTRLLSNCPYKISRKDIDSIYSNFFSQ